MELWESRSKRKCNPSFSRLLLKVSFFAHASTGYWLPLSLCEWIGVSIWRRRRKLRESLDIWVRIFTGNLRKNPDKRLTTVKLVDYNSTAVFFLQTTSIIFFYLSPSYLNRQGNYENLQTFCRCCSRRVKTAHPVSRAITTALTFFPCKPSPGTKKSKDTLQAEDVLHSYGHMLHEQYWFYFAIKTS